VYGNPAPIVFSYNVLDAFGSEMVTDHFRKYFGELGYMITQTPQVWLDHQVFYHEDRVDLVWDAVDGLFEAGIVEDAFAAYIRLVSDLAADATAWSRTVEIALPGHQRASREAVHSTAVRRTATLHERFFDRAIEHPGRTALYRHGAEPVAYGVLADSALRIAASLSQLGVGPSEVVAIVMPKGDGDIAAVLGVLAAGAAYVAVGADVPPERQRQILERAGVRFALTADAGPELRDWPGRVLTIAEAFRGRLGARERGAAPGRRRVVAADPAAPRHHLELRPLVDGRVAVVVPVTAGARESAAGAAVRGLDSARPA
jgi:non-ribosomal peptide synthetase component F